MHGELVSPGLARRLSPLGHVVAAPRHGENQALACQCSWRVRDRELAETVGLLKSPHRRKRTGDRAVSYLPAKYFRELCERRLRRTWIDGHQGRLRSNIGRRQAGGSSPRSLPRLGPVGHPQPDRPQAVECPPRGRDSRREDGHDQPEEAIRFVAAYEAQIGKHLAETRASIARISPVSYGGDENRALEALLASLELLAGRNAKAEEAKASPR
jgi:hypothetical protein